jgi:ribonuclease J
VLAIVAIDKLTGRSDAPAEIVARGFAMDDAQLLNEAKAIVGRTLDGSSPEERKDYGVMKEKIRNELKRFIQKSTSRRPLIMPVIMEI